VNINARLAAAILLLLVAGLLDGFRGVIVVILLVVALQLFAHGWPHQKPRPTRCSARLRVRLPTREFSEGAFLMRLFSNKRYPVTLNAVDEDGNAEPIDGAARFSIEPEGVGAFRAPDPDNFPDEAGFDPNLTQILVLDRGFIADQGGSAGLVTGSVTVVADADRSEGERDITAIGAFEFSLPEAVAGTVDVGDGLPLTPPAG
jgi:hypothetical protein